MRRLGRLLGNQREPRARRGGRSARAPRRHGDPFGNAGNLRRRAPAHAARGVARNRREADPPDPLVGGLHAAQRQRDEQQPFARQQGGRPHDDPRKIARRGRRRAARRTWSTSTNTRKP
jgi:hypothetical protein